MSVITINGDSGSATGLVVTLTGSTSGAVFTGAGSTITESFSYLSLPTTTSTNGQILINSIPFMHAFGTNNTFLGASSGNFTNASSNMIGIGVSALGAAAGGGSTGNNNCIAIGNFNLNLLTSDSDSNIAIGSSVATALTSTCANNVIIGAGACGNSGTGFANNVAIGSSSMTGGTKSACTNNVCIGTSSGTGITSGSNNLLLGVSSGTGVTTGVSNISINGPAGTNTSNQLTIGAGAGTGARQLNKAFIHGIRGITTGVADAVAVLVDSAGQLGTVSSSIRYKENVQDMADVSSALLKLRPVTFDFIGKPSHKKQVGLIAEEVYEVMPDLVVHNMDGLIESVKYHELPALLLNELQKAVKRIDALEVEFAASCKGE